MRDDVTPNRDSVYEGPGACHPCRAMSSHGKREMGPESPSRLKSILETIGETPQWDLVLFESTNVHQTLVADLYWFRLAPTSREERCTLWPAADQR